jgi:uncharacterized protein YwqG
MTHNGRQAFERLPDRVKRCVRPSLRIRTIPTPVDALKLAQSRIGGLPDLPPEFKWPRYDGLALSFIAQLDLAELALQPSVLPLPRQGSLVFFYDSEQRTWGFDPKDRGSAVVSYIGAPTSSLVRTDLPADVSEPGKFQCCALRYNHEQNLPDACSAYYDPELSEDEKTLLFNYHDAVRDQSNAPRHRIGGHADCVQNPMELECQLVTNGLYCGDATGYEDPRRATLASGTLEWRLLLQIDTDDDARMMWGDCGTIYYWIREEDLRACDFDKCWLILQCS